MAALNLAGKTSGYIKLKSPDVALNATVELPNKDGILATLDDVGSGGGGGIPEAPIDGKQYARQDENWTEVNHPTRLDTYRNLIINGDMRIDQRYGGSATTNTISGYVTDRWQVAQSTKDKLIAQQVTDAPSCSTHSLKITSQSAYTVGTSDAYYVRQAIEGQNCSHLNWGTANAKTVTLSFWVKSSLTGTFGGAFFNKAFNRSYAFEYTILSANTWEQKSITISGDTTGTWETNNQFGIGVSFGLGSGATNSGTAGSWSASGVTNTSGATSVVGTSGATFYITGVQLEVGETATPFEHRPYDMELARCQRYYWKTFPTSIAPAQNVTNGNMLFSGIKSDKLAGHDFPVEMRAVPSMITYNPYALNSSFREYMGGDIEISHFTVDTKRVMWINTATSFTAPTGVHGHLTANAEL